MLYHNFLNSKGLIHQMNKMISLTSNKEKRSVVLFSFFFLYKIFPDIFQYLDRSWASSMVVNIIHHSDCSKKKMRTLGLYFNPISTSVFQNPDCSSISRQFTWTGLSEEQMVSGPRGTLRLSNGKERDMESRIDDSHR